MVIDEESREVEKHDGIAIPPGARHKITNTGDGDLIFLCCCVPAYEHNDTVVTVVTCPKKLESQKARS